MAWNQRGVLIRRVFDKNRHKFLEHALGQRAAMLLYDVRLGRGQECKPPPHGYINISDIRSAFHSWFRVRRLSGRKSCW